MKILLGRNLNWASSVLPTVTAAAFLLRRKAVVNDASGHASLAYGLIITVTQATGDRSDWATQQLIQELHRSNPNMKITLDPERVRLNGQPGLATYLSNNSLGGGQETDWVVTTLRPEPGLVCLRGAAIRV